MDVDRHQGRDMQLIKFGVNYPFNPVPVVVSARS
jgi:hypothetical protein